MVLADGDVLAWDEETNVAVVVQINLRDVMVIDLSELKSRSPDELIKTCFELGHALGNQHWKAVTKHNEVYVPLTVATTMMDSVMRTHGFQHLPFRFVKGAEILPLLTNSEARLLFGGAEDTDTHVHVASPLMNLMALVCTFTVFTPTKKAIVMVITIMTTAIAMVIMTTTINTDSGSEAPR